MDNMDLGSDLHIHARWEVVCISLPFTFISVKLFLPLKVQHLWVGTVEHWLKLPGSSNQLPGPKESISNLNWQQHPH